MKRSRIALALGLCLTLIGILVLRLAEKPAKPPAEPQFPTAGETSQPEQALPPIVATSQPPLNGTPFSDPVVQDWIHGQSKRFFPDAEIIETQVYRRSQNIEDRKTLIEDPSESGVRILIEERFTLPEGGPIELQHSHASLARNVVVSLQPGYTATPSNLQTDAPVPLKQSPYSPYTLETGATDSIDLILASREDAQSLDGVRFIEPNYLYFTQTEPNDPSFADGTLWGLHNTGQHGGQDDIDINAPEAWDLRHSAEEIVVAVIDTGIFYTHEDLADNMWVNPNEIPDNDIDDDENGYVDDVYGINAITGKGDPLDDHSHGTHCAGTIGAQGNNETGISGVAWNVKLMGCKFLSAGGWGTLSDAVTAINYATDMGAHITSNSWGGGGYSQTLYEALEKAEDAGIITVAAAGNSRRNTDTAPAYPASYELPSVVSVAAHDRRGNLAWFSNYGKKTVEIAAPGVEIYSTVNSEGGYASYQGTSMACPHVSGALALLKAHYPEEDTFRLINRVVSGAKPVESLEDKVIATGMLDLENSIKTPHFPLKPIFTTSLRTQNYIVGDTINIATEVIGDEPITYQWYFNEEPIAGADAPSLSIPEAEENEQGRYELRATNSAGTTSQNAMAFAYSLTPAPDNISTSSANILWAKQLLPATKQWRLQDRVTPPHANRDFAMESGAIEDSEQTGLLARVEGPGTISYSWKADCDPSGKDGLKLYVDGILQGSLKPYLNKPTDWRGCSYQIPDGFHEVLFTFEKDQFLFAGNDRGWLADFTVYQSGTTSESDTDEEGNQIGNRSQLRIAEGQPALLRTSSYFDSSHETGWKKDDQDLDQSETSIFIPQTTLEDQGTYTFHYVGDRWVDNEWVDTNYKDIFELQVVPLAEALVPPTIERQPEEVTSSFSQVTLSVSVDSLIPVEYLWKRNGSPIENSNSQALIISPFGPELEGQYTLTATNEAGSTTSAPIHVRYNTNTEEAPYIAKQPDLVVVEQGQDALIPIDVEGHSPLQFRWFRDGVPLPGQITPTLKLENASSVLHNGTYLLEASNAFGDARTWPISLSVTSPNGLPDAIDRPTESWYSVGTIPWVLDTKTSADGEDSAFILGTDLKAGESSRLEGQVFGPAKVKFLWNVQGNQYFNLSFLVDGKDTGLRRFGSEGWEEAEYEITEPGLHTVAWQMTSHTLSLGGTLPFHMLSWVDDVEITHPAPQTFLPSVITFSRNHQLDTAIRIEGYTDMEIEGLPDWLSLDKSNLSLKGTPSSNLDHWLKVNMTKQDGSTDTEWVKLQNDNLENDDAWQPINLAGESIVGHYYLNNALTIVQPNGQLHTSEDGENWTQSYLPLSSSSERVYNVFQNGGQVTIYASGNTFTSSDGRHWNKAASLYGEVPSYRQIFRNQNAYYGLNYGYLSFSHDQESWGRIPEGDNFKYLYRIFEIDGDLYGQAHNSILRYLPETNDWEDNAIPISPGKQAFQHGETLYWPESISGSAKLRIVKSTAPLADSPTTLFETDILFSGLAANDEYILLFDTSQYSLLDHSGTLVESGSHEALSSLDSFWLNVASVGSHFTLYTSNSLLQVGTGKHDLPEWTDGSQTYHLVTANDSKVLFSNGTNHLVSSDGIEFQETTTTQYINSLIGYKDRFIGLRGRDVYTSTDGSSWTQVSSYPEPGESEQNLHPTLEYKNGLFYATYTSNQILHEYLSKDAVEWRSIQTPTDETFSSAGYALLREDYLKLAYYSDQSGWGNKLLKLSDEEVWEEVRSFPRESLTLHLPQGSNKLTLKSYNKLYQTTDLENWDERSIPHNSDYIQDTNALLYSIAQKKLEIYNSDFVKTHSLTLPITPQEVSYFNGNLYLTDSNGNAIRYPIPTENNRIQSPLHQRSGPIDTTPFLYVTTPEILENNANLNEEVGTIGLANLELANPISFTLAQPSPSNHNGFFRVEGNKLYAKQNANFETHPELLVEMTATGSQQASLTDLIPISVLNLPEAPTDLRLTAQIFAANTPSGTPLATFYGIDPDQYESFSYEFASGEGSDHNELFEIANNALVSNSSFDIEQRSTYKIRAKVTDSTGLSFSRAFILNLVPQDNLNAGAFDVWIREKLHEHSAGYELFSVDSDFDGRPNGLEYYLNSDPSQSDKSPNALLKATPTHENTESILLLKVNDPHLIWKCFHSQDLKTWHDTQLEFNQGQWSLPSDSPLELTQATHVDVGLWELHLRPIEPATTLLLKLEVQYNAPN
ncbi:S8 family serine peptidase [Pelagicoccus mobilis]|uniref:S8 family serine peptidase n=1 Tax=Pelagicoccus mobilis TaxID=415221 RepID=A0A934RUY0_9BACT|nr:S8 family serine peptidase [Pelagicoccus mobilis]MBK1878125.1 S8 family serine peptidase [Pelagicoccus mobilis]